MESAYAFHPILSLAVSLQKLASLKQSVGTNPFNNLSIEPLVALTPEHRNIGVSVSQVFGVGESKVVHGRDVSWWLPHRAQVTRHSRGAPLPNDMSVL